MSITPPIQAPLKAVGFDLGDTLVEYEGVPASWETFYTEALVALADKLGVAPADTQLASAHTVLRAYNTRLNPREVEISFGVVLRDICAVFAVPTPSPEIDYATAFFAVFRKRLRAFANARSTLERLHERGLKVGIFTDVPYGMPRELAEKDIHGAGLTDLVDVLVTSRDAGRRKPAREALQALATVFGTAPDEMVYIGNEEKDIAAAQAFGCRSILIDRANVTPKWGQNATITSLAPLPELLTK